MRRREKKIVAELVNFLYKQIQAYKQNKKKNNKNF